MDDDSRSPRQEVAGLLARHAARRRAGSPVLCTLVGSTRAAIDFWKQWATDQSLRPALIRTSDPNHLAAHVLHEIATAHALPRLAFRHLQATAGLTPAGAEDFWATRTAHDVEQLAMAASARPDRDGTTDLARWLVDARLADGSAIRIEQLDTVLQSAVGRPGWRVLRALDGLLSTEARPAVLLLPSADNGATGNWPDAIAEPAAQMVEAVPGWAIGVVCPAAEWERFRRTAASSRAKSLLLSGEIPVPTLDAATLKDRLREAVGGGAELDRAAESLSAVGATDRLAEAYVAAARLRPNCDDAARSAAERFLFELLELHPRTAGRFALNGHPGFPFGPSAAEVDLFAAGLRLAVEVDGYHHFTEPAAYRRDRRKDWELQRHGFAVVRVLAEDVVARTEEVLDTILAAVDHRDPQTPRGGI